MTVVAPHHLDGRRRRSERTRRRILEAARTLFADRGYVATTVDSVAQEAGVAAQTVYYVFGTKPLLLAAVLDERIAGEPGAGPVASQPWVADLEAASTGEAAVDALVQGGVEIIARATPIYEVVRAAAADPEVAELLTRNRAERRADQRRLVASLDQRGLLASDVDLDHAADVVYGILNEEVFQLLTVDCGWPTERFRAWVGGSLRRELLGE